MNKNKLVLVSTPRHFYLSIGLAFANKEYDYHLVFIDQKTLPKDNELYQAILNVSGPFKSVDCSVVRQSEAKASNRRAVAIQLKELVSRLQPIEIIAGNDRRFEFQYSMHIASRAGYANVTGGYLDDGTGSYIGFDAARKIKYLTDRYIDTPIKKLVYGHWYHRPRMLGMSRWVQRRYLCHPELASGGEVVALSPDDYLTDVVVDYMAELVNYMGDTQGYDRGGSLLIVLPHSSIVSLLYGGIEGFKVVLDSLIQKAGTVYVKYHPREHADPLELEGKVVLLKSNLPLEMYLSLLKVDRVIGDVSTGLMSCKWLYPDLDVSAIKNNSNLSQSIGVLYDSLKIRSMEVK